jgi:hypothetical protein
MLGRPPKSPEGGLYFVSISGIKPLVVFALSEM